MAGNCWKSILNWDLCFFAIVLNFSAFCDLYAVYKQYNGLLQKTGMYSFPLNAISAIVFKNILSTKGRNLVDLVYIVFKS